MSKLIPLLASLLLVLNLASCTSNDSKDDETGDESVAESTEGTDGDLENLDAPPSDNVASTDAAADGFLDEQLPEDALGESTSSQTTADAKAGDDLKLDDGAPPPVMEEPKPSDTAAADAPPPIEPAPDVAAMTSEPAPPPLIEEPPPTTPDTSIGAFAGTTEDTSKPVEEPKAEAPKPKASLKKVEPAPFSRKKVLLNAVYVARPGDNYKKISELIYGDGSRQKELKNVNPSISKPRPGDKIYYNSPVRPTDDTKLLTFYEDAGQMPEVYVAKEGDNLKKVAKELLGYDNAWKELWVTNAIDSKDELAAGTEIRYWKSAPATFKPPKTDVAMGEPPPAMGESAPMPDLPPPPPAEPMPPVAQNEMAPPPPPAEMAPPPPPPAEMAPPPPPPAADLPPPPPPEAVSPPPSPVAKNGDVLEEGGMDQDMLMSLAGAGIIAIGLAAIIIIRKKRQNRDMATAFNDTQVGT